jgi:hypothetical protein
VIETLYFRHKKTSEVWMLDVVGRAPRMPLCKIAKLLDPETSLIVELQELTGVLGDYDLINEMEALAWSCR